MVNGFINMMFDEFLYLNTVHLLVKFIVLKAFAQSIDSH